MESTKAVAVIGAQGAMGQRLVRCFRDLGHEVLEADIATQLRATEAAAQADVVVLSVPIDTVPAVVAEVAPVMRPEALLADVTSTKGVPLGAMMASFSGAVVGMHPLFGPGVASLAAQRVVLCPGRGEAWFDWLKAELSRAGAQVVVTSAEEHDDMMAIVQVLVHLRTQVFGLALSQLEPELDKTLAFTSPAYLLELYVAARHFAQSPALYGPLEMRNPRLGQVLEAFREASERLAGVLRARDTVEFDRIFKEVRAFFGGFAEEASTVSDALINTLPTLRAAYLQGKGSTPER